MHDVALDAAWGEWFLGDLATVLRRAGDALGHGETVEEVRVVPPKTLDELPVVTVVVPHVYAPARLAEDLAESDFPVQWVEEPGEDPSEQGWAAEVLGVRLVVRAERSTL